MIPVTPLNAGNEPPAFNANCREPGQAWLAAHPNKDPHDKSEWWSAFRSDLAKHFNYRCGWLATTIVLEGDVDHWLSCGPRTDAAGGLVNSPNRDLAFEWSNYRYATGKVNSLKGNLDDQVIDPCEIQNDWFEVILPSFELRVANIMPEPLREKAEFTLAKLQLRRHNARFTRWYWYCAHWNDGNINLDGLRRDAPQVARAVEKSQAAGQQLPDPNICEPKKTHPLRKHKYRARARNC